MSLSPQDKGRLYEKQLEKEGRASRRPLSGAAYFAKEDLITEHELIQAKYHEPSASMSIKQEWFDDLWRHAAQVRRTGVLFLSWNNKEYVILKRKDYENHVILDEQLCQLCQADAPEVCRGCVRNKTNAALSSSGKLDWTDPEIESHSSAG